MSLYINSTGITHHVPWNEPISMSPIFTFSREGYVHLTFSTGYKKFRQGNFYNGKGSRIVLIDKIGNKRTIVSHSWYGDLSDSCNLAQKRNRNV